MQELMPPISTPDNVFHDGDPTTGAFGTIVPSLWLNNVQFAVRDLQQECKSILTKAGFVPDPRKQNQLADAISQLIKTSVPAATVGRSGIVSLSNATNSNSETDAATSKAVKTAYDLASSANQNAGNANDNANKRLEKSKNGADILDPKLFVENLGLAGTVDRANNAMSKGQNGADISDKNAFVNNLGLSELVYRTIGNGPNQIPDMSFFSAGGGYMKFPDGKMIQYGYTQSDPNEPKIINFPTPFAQECFGVTSSGTDPNAANISGCGVIDRFGFHLSAWHVGSETTNITATINRTATHISWIAIGI